jgi:glutamine synthetase
MSDQQKEQVLKMAKDHDVKFIRLWFTDILGVLKSFAITNDELETALDEGMGFDGSSIQGYARIDSFPGDRKRRPWQECLQTFTSRMGPPTKGTPAGR